MKKIDLYLYLNILNILLVICMFGMFLIYFVLICVAENWIFPNCFMFLSIFVKIFLLYILFNTFEKSFPNVTFSKIAIELKNNINSRKLTLLLAFTYDALIMLCLALHDIIEYRFEWISLVVYAVITLGGVGMFYIALFTIWKFQGKLKA